MQPRSLQYIAQACQGRLRCGDSATLASRICTDSRKIQPGDLFLALVGDAFDGHNFLAEVVQKGALALVVESGKCASDTLGVAVIEVDETRRALGRLAAAYRRDFDAAMIAVGGSNGKTTTKELVASVLRETMPVLWSEASFNNDIGVPLTLMNLDTTHRAAVLEVGTNHPGELTPLLRMIQPRYGVLTSVGREHLEFFGDLTGVAAEEGCLAEALPPEGRFFVNGDTSCLDMVLPRARCEVVKLGFGPQNDWRVQLRNMDEHGMEFHVQAPDSQWTGDYRMPLIGRHQAGNALFAIALGAQMGLSAVQIQNGLSHCPQPKMRLEIWRMGGVCIVNDAYNANADSMGAALHTLRDIPCAGRRIAVLGDMAELGPHSEKAHAEMGCLAATLGLDVLCVVGQWSTVMADAARAAGLKHVETEASTEAMAPRLDEWIKPGDSVLFKGSRSVRMERLVQRLREKLQASSETAVSSPVHA